MNKELNMVSLLEESFKDLPHEGIEEVGIVMKVADGVALVYGLLNAAYGERIMFDGGNEGIVFDLDEDFASVILLDRLKPVIEQEVARRTGKPLSIPVGNGLLGRVINATGEPLDGRGEIISTEAWPVERSAPGIADRSSISESLETGIMVIDALIPIGKGQRELIVGNMSTGKTSIAVDTILHQKGRDVICIFVSIGRKQSDTARLLDTFESHGALDYTIIVSADASDSALDQFVAPYAGCSIGEYFMEQGKDVLIVYDNLTNHAIAYRELSLLLRRPPGREAYPGDIFYIHSRLLERACKLSEKRGGGSLTALPLVLLQGDDISSYIPTNLISITDGQIILDVGLFNQGIRPAVNIGLSVSRVGTAAQTKVIKKMSSGFKLEIARYEELLAFAQFGSELDHISKDRIDRGMRAIEMLKQDRYETFSFVDQSLFLFLHREKIIDRFKIDDVADFIRKFALYVRDMHKHVYQAIENTQDITDDMTRELIQIAGKFSLAFH